MDWFVSRHGGEMPAGEGFFIYIILSDWSRL